MIPRQPSPNVRRGPLTPDEVPPADAAAYENIMQGRVAPESELPPPPLIVPDDGVVDQRETRPSGPSEMPPLDELIEYAADQGHSGTLGVEFGGGPRRVVTARR